jgi:hypothetical protein
MGRIIHRAGGPVEISDSAPHLLRTGLRAIPGRFSGDYCGLRGDIGRVGLYECRYAYYAISDQQPHRQKKHAVVVPTLRLSVLFSLSLLFLALSLCFYAQSINDQSFINWRYVMAWIVLFVGSQVFGYLALVSLWG